ncbi:fimbria/pilus outer membrane usher protein [Salmonella enterica subsp. enterica]|nr:pilin outer membrane usher protein SafC [Salmonella enterica subsp. enterica]EED9676019.1 fimbria/pilus outer membrane usher protein [Salmonella enterica subsp. enterica]
MKRYTRRVRYLCLCILISLTRSIPAKTWHFDSSMVGSGGAADISLLEAGGQLPGTYLVTVKVNGEVVDNRKVDFRPDMEKQQGLSPCLSVRQLARYGVRVEDFFEDADLTEDDRSRKSPSACVRLNKIPQATATFDFYEQTLLLSIPQAALHSRKDGLAPVELWDDGIPALLMNYDASISRSVTRTGRAVRTDTSYVQLRPGLNLGAWRIRQALSWQRSGEQQGKWQTVYTRAERGILPLKARLFVGELMTSSDVFNGLPFRGVMLNTDDRVIPWGEREFSPVVRGIAHSQARVEVRQQGYLVYSTTVAPGAFELTDMPARGGGDLDVTVTEADGRTQYFRVPFGIPAIALRKGAMKYHLAGGVYRPADRSVDRVPLWQVTVMYGLPQDITVMGGGQIARHYQSVALGAGTVAGQLGAISLDTVHFRGIPADKKQQQGAMWRLRYNKTLAPSGTGTYLGLMHYTSGHYSSMSEVLDTWKKEGEGATFTRERSGLFPRNRVELSLNQPLGRFGNLNISGERVFWQRGGQSGSLNAGWSVYLPGDISLSLNLSRSTSPSSGTDRMVSLMFSLPLERWLSPGSGASWQMTSSSGDMSQEAGIYGHGFDRRLYWDLRQSTPVGPAEEQHFRQSMHMDWTGTYGQLGGNYSRTRTMEQMETNISGGVLLHHHGMTFGQSMGDTVALIEAPGANDVAVGQWPGIRTDFRGYTMLGQITPYQPNMVSLDPASLPSSVDIQQTDVRVIPTTGAVIPVRFITHSGQKALITLLLPEGDPVPFGAVVRLVQNDRDAEVNTGIVGDAGEVYLAGLPENGTLDVQWGHDGTQQCGAGFLLATGGKQSGGVVETKAVCYPVMRGIQQKKVTGQRNKS